MKISNIGLVFLIFFWSCGNKQENNNVLKKDRTSQSKVFESTKNTSGTSVSVVDIIDSLPSVSIKLTPFIPSYEDLSPSLYRFLKDRLNIGITTVGYGGEGGSPRFIIGPSLNITSSNLTSTAPQKYLLTFEVNLFVVDVMTETIFNSYSSQFKGVGSSKELALQNGFRNLDFKNQDFINFLKQAELKIFNFFNENCSIIIAEADAEASMRNFESAFSILKSIPRESTECNKLIQQKKLEYFQLSLDSECQGLLSKMKSELGTFNDSSGSGFNPEAMHYFSLIDPQSSCYKEAQDEYKKYISKLDPKGKRNWDQKLIEYNNEIELVRQDKEFEREEKRMANEYQIKVKELEAKIEIEGNSRLLAKYKHDESPWLIRLFSSGRKLFKGELNTSK